MIESRKGISANQLKRTIGVSYKSAWYLCHRIRHSMKEGNTGLLGGIVEVDETWIGGKARGMGHGYKGNKIGVAGAIERDGDARLDVIRARDKKTLHAFIHSHVKPNAKAIYTDEWPSYKGIGDEDTKHATVNHSIEEWVNGNVHTNSVENVWSLLKRSIIGSYHKVSVKHLQAYLEELEFRFNNRNNPYIFRDALLNLLKAETLTYEQLKERKTA